MKLKEIIKSLDEEIKTLHKINPYTETVSIQWLLSYLKSLRANLIELKTEQL